MKFTEAELEAAFIKLLQAERYTHVAGDTIARQPGEVLLKQDMEDYLFERYATDNITAGEVASIISQLEAFSVSALYQSNKAIMKMIADGFPLKREDHNKTDLYIQLIDYSDLTARRAPQSTEPDTVAAENAAPDSARHNRYKIVSQLEISGSKTRIPDAILYINGLPLVVFEFKSTSREETTIHDAYIQLTSRYRRDIPVLFKYNAFCVISDGVNSKMGALFAPYAYFYAWRQIDDAATTPKDGIGALYTMIRGLFCQQTLIDVIQNFIFMPDQSRRHEKIVCRYPQYYAAKKLYANIKRQCRPQGDGKGGTYFGATGCGKSFTMLFLTRLLMKSVDFASPTIVLITDRTDLDDQLSAQFTQAKRYLGDENVISVTSRQHLRTLLANRNSGGVFLTTIHKFTEDTQLLTMRDKVICISDEAHRSQLNLDQKVLVTENGVRR